MIENKEIKKIIKARLKDAQVLFDAKRYDGAVYLCGYAVELGLKFRICKTLKWSGFPSSNGEFRKYEAFKTHDLDVLLHLTGIEARIKSSFFAEWSVVVGWNSESRYNPIGSVTALDAQQMIISAKTLAAKL